MFELIEEYLNNKNYGLSQIIYFIRSIHNIVIVTITLILIHKYITESDWLFMFLALLIVILNVYLYVRTEVWIEYLLSYSVYYSYKKDCWCVTYKYGSDDYLIELSLDCVDSIKLVESNYYVKGLFYAKSKSHSIATKLVRIPVCVEKSNLLYKQIKEYTL